MLEMHIDPPDRVCSHHFSLYGHKYFTLMVSVVVLTEDEEEALYRR